jgi:hypothetical protein
MFTADIVWRGIVYTVLMLFAKAVAGLWLVRVKIPRPMVRISTGLRSFSLLSVCKPKASQSQSKKTKSHEMKKRRKTDGNSAEIPESGSGDFMGGGTAPASMAPPEPPPVSKNIDKPLSLYPAAILGTAMTARGEIGFLIASLAETTGLFAFSDATKRSTGSSEIYLVVTWAIVLCTIIGPLSVGMLVKRVRRLQSERENNPGKADPLGIWGVN